MRRPVPCSMPFVQLNRIADLLVSVGAKEAATLRNAMEGVTKTMTSESEQSARFAVRVMFPGNVTAGR